MINNVNQAIDMIVELCRKGRDIELTKSGKDAILAVILDNAYDLEVLCEKQATMLEKERNDCRIEMTRSNELMAQLEKTRAHIMLLKAQLGVGRKEADEKSHHLAIWRDDLQKWASQYCPHCGSSEVHEFPLPSAKYVMGEKIVSYRWSCADCQWSWRLNESGVEQDLDDGVPF